MGCRFGPDPGLGSLICSCMRRLTGRIRDRTAANPDFQVASINASGRFAGHFKS
jgi:hypothetical protein